MRRFIKRLLRIGPREVRIKGAKRGRLYERPDEKDGSTPGGRSKTRPVGRIRARVMRKETGQWEDLGVISEELR